VVADQDEVDGRAAEREGPGRALAANEREVGPTFLPGSAIWPDMRTELAAFAAFAASWTICVAGFAASPDGLLLLLPPPPPPPQPAARKTTASSVLTGSPRLAIAR
jgi:hypothetical protein